MSLPTENVTRVGSRCETRDVVLYNQRRRSDLSKPTGDVGGSALEVTAVSNLAPQQVENGQAFPRALRYQASPCSSLSFTAEP